MKTMPMKRGKDKRDVAQKNNNNKHKELLKKRPKASQEQLVGTIFPNISKPFLNTRRRFDSLFPHLKTSNHYGKKN